MVNEALVKVMSNIGAGIDWESRFVCRFRPVVRRSAAIGGTGFQIVTAPAGSMLNQNLTVFCNSSL